MESRIEWFSSSEKAVVGDIRDISYEQTLMNSTYFETTEAHVTTTPVLNATVQRHLREQAFCSVANGRKTTVAEIVACFIAVLTVVENFVILVAITRGNRSLRKPPYWFIASLASADLFTGFEVVLAVFVPIGNSPLSRIALKGAAVVTFIASINSLLLVSMDRYIRIVRHADYNRLLGRKKIFAAIALSWLISIALFLAAPLLGWSCGGKHCCAHDGLCTCLRSKYGDDCGLTCSQSFVPFTKTYIFVGVLYFMVAILVMTAFYGLIFRVVKAKTFAGGDSKTQNKKWQRRDVRLAKTLVITLGIFILCWLPVVGLFIADLATSHHNENLSKVFDYALVPSIINSFLNPIIYSIRLPHMRTAIQRIFFPCTYDASSLVSSTSVEKRTFKRFSLRRKSDRKRLKTASTSSGAKHPSPPQPTRENLLSTSSAAENTPAYSRA